MTYVAAPTAEDMPLDGLARHPADVLGRLGLAESDDADPAERRRKRRVSTNKSVKLFDPASGQYFSGHTCDVSDSGLCLTLPARLPAFAGGTASVYVADASNVGFAARSQMHEVRYVWVRRDARTGTATCGVEIVKNAGRNRVRLAA